MFVFKVYLKNIGNQTAKVTKIAITEMAFTPILSDQSTIKGPIIAPTNPKHSAIPMAVDWIWAVKAYVWTEAINV